MARQLRLRPGRTQNEIAPAIRTGAAETLLHASDAKRALETANPGVRIAVWKIAITAFAVRAEREGHADPLNRRC